MTNPCETLALRRATGTALAAVLAACLGVQPCFGAPSSSGERVSPRAPSSSGEQAAASAETHSPERVQLGYAAPLGCPTREAFVATVAQRTDRLAIVQSSEPSTRALVVRIVADGERFVGELEIAQDGRQPSLRRFEDSSCDQVVAALALIVVLSATTGRWYDGGETDAGDLRSLEPSGQAPAVLTLESLEEPQGPALPELHNAHHPRKPSGEARPRPVKPRRALARTTPAENPLPKGAGRLSYFIGASLAATVGPASVALLSPAPTLGISTAVGPLGAHALDFELTPVLAKTGFLGADAAGIALRWMALRVGLCPRFELGYSFALSPCLRADGGMLTVENEDPAVEPLSPRHRPWFALGPGAALGWGEPFNVELGGALLVPVVRDKFVVLSGRGSESVYQPGRVGGGLELRLGWRFL